VIPLTRPAIATVLAFQLIPVWNDLWFPLTVAPGENARTVTLGMTIFAGQYRNDWSSLLAGLSLAMMPVTLLFVIFPGNSSPDSRAARSNRDSYGRQSSGQGTRLERSVNP
jgi:ABC-type maltose transport system permease subunit